MHPYPLQYGYTLPLCSFSRRIFQAQQGLPDKTAHLSYNDLHCFTQCPLRVSSCSRRRIQAHESLPDTPRICASTAYTHTLNDQRLGQRAQKHLRITAYITHDAESSGASHSAVPFDVTVSEATSLGFQNCYKSSAAGTMGCALH